MHNNITNIIVIFWIEILIYPERVKTILSNDYSWLCTGADITVLAGGYMECHEMHAFVL